MKPILISSTDTKHLVELLCFGAPFTFDYGEGIQTGVPKTTRKICVIDAPSADVAIETAREAITGTLWSTSSKADEKVLRAELVSVIPTGNIPDIHGLLITRREKPDSQRRELVYVPCSREEAIENSNTHYSDTVLVSDGRRLWTWMANDPFTLEATSRGEMIYMRLDRGFDLPKPDFVIPDPRWVPEVIPTPRRLDDNDLPPSHEDLAGEAKALDQEREDEAANRESSWIEDDSDVVNAIEEAKEDWFSAHAGDSLPATDETTDGEINKALDLPWSGALRPLSDEFATWSKDKIQDAVKTGLDTWALRARLALEREDEAGDDGELF